MMSSFISSLEQQQVWRQTWFNAEDSVLPFVLPFTFWMGAYWHSKRQRQKPFHKWYALHNFHNFGAIGLGLASLTCNDDAIFNERIPILWSLSYFVVDTLDCVSRRDVTYTFHALFCMALGVANYTTPACRRLRMNSKATFCELSNPFMHLVKRKRQASYMVLFCAVFTACRIVWIPIMMRQLLTQGNMQYTHPIMLCLTAFYGLNWMWYYKIWRIIISEGAKVLRSQSNDDENGDKPKEE